LLPHTFLPLPLVSLSPLAQISLGSCIKPVSCLLLFYIIKELFQPTGNFFSGKREGGGGREREGGVRERGVGKQAGTFKVRLGLVEIEGRDGDTER
jgi:hypothetical protein